MLAALSIRDIVLIEQLDLEFEAGLCVLSGETGAGKSILLDSLMLALGGRGDGALVRKGADKGSVTAVFEFAAGSPVDAELKDNGLEADGPLILRRVQFADGRTRAFVNDMPVNAGLLRRIGSSLAEIYGQHDTRLLADMAAQRDILDEFGNLGNLCRRTAAAFEAWSGLNARLHAMEDEIAKAGRDADFLRHSCDELAGLALQKGEEDELASARQLMMNAEKITSGLNDARKALSGDAGLERRITGAMRALERLQGADELLAPPFAALERALVEASEAQNAIDAALDAAQYNPVELEHTEERLFTLRAAARKYNVSVDDLPELAERMAAQLAALDTSEQALDELRVRAGQAERAFFSFADDLSRKRLAVARELDKRVMAELAPLKLERAVFFTSLERHVENCGVHGFDKVQFLVTTNPGASPGPLDKIASGGELARFMLALKVVSAAGDGVPVMIFDEIDAGVGGAVADAVGARLHRLAEKTQVLTVTHSPQVAARGQVHMLISKHGDGDELPRVRVELLRQKERREEIARMLSGAKITDEARAAAARLLGQEL